MSGIFISYRRSDDPAYAGRLYDRLSAHFGEDQVFMDVDSVPLGIDFVEYIEQTVEKVNALVAVIGPTWLTCSDEKGTRRLDQLDDFVRIEIRHALARDIRVVPVLVRGAKMPKAEELPEDMRSLARRNALQVTDTEWRAGVDRLIESLEHVLTGAPPGKPAPKSRSSRRPAGTPSPPRPPRAPAETVVAQANGLSIATQPFRAGGFPISGYWPEGPADIVVTSRRLIVRPHTGGEVSINLEDIGFTAAVFGRIEVYARDNSKNFYIQLPTNFPGEAERQSLAVLAQAIGR